MNKEHDKPGSTETRANESLDPRQPHAPNQIEIGDIVSGLDPAELVEVNRIAPFTFTICQREQKKRSRRWKIC